MNRREFVQTLGAAAGTAVAGRRHHPPIPPLHVDGERLMRHFRALFEFGKTPAGGVSRVAYSDADLRAREFVMRLMRQAGLSVRIDAGGNVLGRRAGRDDSLPPLLFGSHIDSVPDGGNYDGNVGSMGALEAAWTLADRGILTRHPVEVVIFQNEEGGLIGSSLMVGELAPSVLDQQSHSGKTIREGIAALGGDMENLEAAVRRTGDVHAYLELHIEQGGLLEEADLDIGVVEGIVSIRWWNVRIEGFANHAGTTPMDQRRDALLAAARFIEAVNRIIKSVPGRQVGTVGKIEAHPGAPNVIPGEVRASLEIRDLDAAKIQRLFGEIEAAAHRIAEATGTTFTITDTEINTPPAPTDVRIRRTIDSAADDLGLGRQRMPSGAGHDAQSLARIAPVGMLFVPSVGGISHSPREFTRPEDLVNGANVLLNSVLALDRVEL